MTDWIFEHTGLFIILMLVIAIALIVGLVAWLSPISCNAITQNIGYPHTWTFWGGCRIEVEDNKWIPLDNYRYFGDGIVP